MDDHTFFLLNRIESDIRRPHLVLEQLCIHVAELPPNRTFEARRWLRRAEVLTRSPLQNTGGVVGAKLGLVHAMT